MRAALPDNAEERTLLVRRSHELRHIDDLIHASELPTETVSATLSVMELISCEILLWQQHLRFFSTLLLIEILRLAERNIRRLFMH